MDAQEKVAISEQARRSREEQGLPPGIEDEATLARVAELLRVAEGHVREGGEVHHMTDDEARAR